MNILKNPELAHEIKSLFNSGTLRKCAVAFWGPYWAKKAKQHNVEVILDLSMNSTSRNALKSFGYGICETAGHFFRPNEEKVWVYNHLHAKIYIGTDKAIIGSANASTNALGEDSTSPLLTEAGIVIEKATDREAFERIEKIYDELKAGSAPLTEEMFCMAPELPQNMASRDMVGEVDDSALFDVLRHPEQYQRTGFVFGDFRITDNEFAEAKDEFNKDQEESIEISKVDIICMIEDDQKADEKLLGCTQIILFWLNTYSGMYCYKDIKRVAYHEGSRSVVTYWGQLVDTTKHNNRSAKIKFAFDIDMAEKIASSAGDKKGGKFVIFSPDEVYAFIEGASAESQS